MGKFEEAYARLNEAQKLAVDTLDGPVLVIAGPGTGKTQLLTTRIANILAKTDAAAANILCLTFTESAVTTMRERLAAFIGQAAYDVTISTYHAFGSDLIRRFPDYFSELADTAAIDELGADTMFREIVAKLPYSNPLKFSDNYIGDIRALVSDAKRALLTPQDLHDIAAQNLKFIKQATPVVREQLAGVRRLDKKSILSFTKLLSSLTPAFAGPGQPLPRSEPLPRGKLTFEPKVSKDQLPARTQPKSLGGSGWPPAVGGTMMLAELFLKSLAEAAVAAEESGKTTALTAWKNAWLAKDEDGNFIVGGEKANHKLEAAADIYADYLAELKKRKLFDYDDMILRAVHALETNADLRFTLQEQYLYILLDEFQDTNGAQLKLVELLTSSPVHEGRPNVLAVGDDDQAIYAFQGADYSHMLQFQRLYRDVLLVPLTKNYRSHADILHVARGIAEQIETRLHHHFPAIEKTLTAENRLLPKRAIVERSEAKSDLGQFAWTARKIRALINGGLPASEIAVLAPQHKYLEPLVAFLHQEGVPVRYEKRENVLDDPAVQQLLRMSELTLALANGDQMLANHLWPEVLSFAFWELPTSVIWELSWQANDDHKAWTDALLTHLALQPIALFFIRLGWLASGEPIETMLDYLIGVQPLDLQEPDGVTTFVSPFYSFYFDATHNALTNAGGPVSPASPTEPAAAALGGGPPRAATPKSQGTRKMVHGDFWNLLTNLIVLRARLRGYRADENEPLLLNDFVRFAEAHRAADIKILNTSPYQEATDAVQLLTAFKAKGQEYTAVFVLATNDEAWGSKARGQSSRLSIPPNLQFIRYAGATNDERLRLFYVAMTRAKSQLYLVNYTSTYSGKTLSRLKYLNETADNGIAHSPLLPAGEQAVRQIEDEGATPTTELAAYWQQRHEHALGRDELAGLLANRLEKFQLSATHLGDFTDLLHAGPEAFFLKTILRFPEGPRPEVQFGNAIHETLEWIHLRQKQDGALPMLKAVQRHFEQRLRSKRLSEQHTALLIARGLASLAAYYQQRKATVSPANQSEYNFRSEGVFVGKAHLGGKIDKLIIDRQQKTIVIVDYKTGQAYARWSRDLKLHKYEQQLYFYKLLVEGSRSFAGFKVTDAYLEFVEPDEQGNIVELHLPFDDAREQELSTLIQAVWDRVRALQLPDISSYSQDLSGIEAFERDLRGES